MTPETPPDLFALSMRALYTMDQAVAAHVELAQALARAAIAKATRRPV